jgi:hypothetical protein
MGLEHICRQILTHRTEGRSSVECSVSLRYDQRILQLGQWVIHGLNSWIQWRNSAFFLKLPHTTSGTLHVAPILFISLHIHRAVIHKVYTGLTSNSIQSIPHFVKIAQLVQTLKWQVTRTHIHTPQWTTRSYSYPYGMAACWFCFSVILWRCQCLRSPSIDGRKRDEWSNGKDLEGDGGHWHFDVLSQQFVGETEEDHKKPQSGQFLDQHSNWTSST